MEIVGGSCRLGLWFVHVWWNDTTVHQVRFARTGIPGRVPELIRRYCAGQVVNLSQARHYRRSRKIRYTAGFIGRCSRCRMAALRRTERLQPGSGTSPRVVGQAMARNPVPLVIPCHRIVAADGIGGFSSPVEIKEALLAMEKKGLRKAKK